MNFIKECKFLCAGFFPYSREDGTPAYKLKNQVEEKVKQSRAQKLYKAQAKISKELLKNCVGKTISVTCDGIDYENQYFYGRPYFFAPEIDGKVYFTYEDGVIMEGETYAVKITKSTEYDLYGEVVDELT